MTTYKAVNNYTIKVCAFSSSKVSSSSKESTFFNRGHVYIDQTYTVIY